VTIPSEFGLDGHSDADVLLHAVTDALLGAAALGDIGMHFPDTDPQWKGAASARFLEHAVALLSQGMKVATLDLGATDYVTKPFSFDELAARVRAHLRDRDEASSTRLELGDIRVDLVGRRVERAGVPIRLTTTEFDLLAFFMRHPGQVLTRGELLRAVWGFPRDVDSSVVNVYVGYLRRKLTVADAPAPIETIRSVGYRLQGDG
jgi:DNA-binding response OmpR family regulator